jgi:uncharacterized membrane protein YqhA
MFGAADPTDARLPGDTRAARATPVAVRYSANLERGSEDASLPRSQPRSDNRGVSAREAPRRSTGAMLLKLLSLRYLYAIAVAFTLINSAVFLLVGARYSIEGWSNLYRRFFLGEDVPNARLPLLESLDWFLVALVFLIFSLGIAKIFIGYAGTNEDLPEWLRIDSFKELKVLLWETILVTLVVWSISTIARRLETLGWDALVLPVVVFVLAAGLYLMRGKET